MTNEPPLRPGTRLLWRQVEVLAGVELTELKVVRSLSGLSLEIRDVHGRVSRRELVGDLIDLWAELRKLGEDHRSGADGHDPGAPPVR